MSVSLFAQCLILAALWLLLAWLCLRTLGSVAAGEIGKRRHARAILQSDPILRDYLQKKAKLTERQKEHDDEAIEQIVKDVPAHVLQVLSVAGTQKQIEIDLDTVVVKEKTLFPTSDIEPVPMSSMEQVSDILPEQMMLDDDQFYNALAHDELLILQPYERIVEKKTLHVSLDLSQSMTERMADSKARHNWSRGMTISLLLKAINGEATYLLRGFASGPYQLQRVADAEEAAGLIDELLETPANGQSTDIYGALRQAVADVRAHKGESDIADILIITDGLDNGGNVSASTLKQLFGSDIRLHVAAIGETSSVLQSVATSYQVFK
ncbi:VWA domain-containing protein [bacterium]|nr:VWA domain-containing protein [bacterium]